MSIPDNMQILFSMSTALLVGLLMSRIAKLVKLPAVTAYLVTGILVGPYVLGRFHVMGLGFVSQSNVDFFEIISNVALGFIAFSIGNEFRMEQLKKTGKASVVVAVFEALGATILVDIVLIALHFILGDKYLTLPMAITLGAIATATAPAATLMVVKQYKADGPLTRILLPVVALDDAVCLMVFAVSFGIAKAMTKGEFSLKSILLEPVLEVLLSLVLGFGLGQLFSFLERFFKSRSKRLSLSITFVFIAVAVSMLEGEIFGIKIAFSPLLVCMMMGTVFCNICDFSEELMDRADRWTAPLYILFFVLSGAELEFDVFKSIPVVIIGLVYIITRSLGKTLGAAMGTKLMKTPPTVSKYLGFTLLPQAGVALGMSMAVGDLGEDGSIVRNIVLFAVLIYELFGPLVTKTALMKAGEINPDEIKSSAVPNQPAEPDKQAVSK